ncbi:MAG: hypothetical protein AAFP20_01400 [Cyanobacteria bacterium J06614_10]
MKVITAATKNATAEVIPSGGVARSDGVGPVNSVSGWTHPDLRYAPATPPEGIYFRLVLF